MFYVTIIIMNVVKTNVKTYIFWRLAKKIPAEMLNACASHVNLAFPLGKYLKSS